MTQGLQYLLNWANSFRNSLQEIIERWLEDPWGYVVLADACSHLFPDPGPRHDDSRAIAYLIKQGLALTGRRTAIAACCSTGSKRYGGALRASRAQAATLLA